MAAQPSSSQHLLWLLAKAWDSEQGATADSIPWAEVARLAQGQGVTPLLHVAAQRLRVRPPDEVAQVLRLAYYHTAAENTLRMEQMAPIHRAFLSLGVPLLLLKGTAMASALYGNLALRAMADLDLATPRDRADECYTVMVAMGYLPSEAEERPGTRITYRSEQAFAPSKPLQVPVDLHWHLLDIPYYLEKVPMDWFWDNTDPIEVSGLPARVLNAEADLLYLSAHLALHHRLHGLRWFADLAWLIHKHRGTLDWHKVIACSQHFELLLVVRETLGRLKSLWPSLPLDTPLQQMAALSPTSQERLIFRLLTAEPRTPFLDFYGDIVGLPDLPARLRFVAANTFPQAGYLFKRYPIRHRWQLPYWYLFRLGDGLVKSLRTLPQALQLSAGSRDPAS